MNQLTIVERSTIYAFRHQGKSFRFIARELGRAASTVLREFKRNLRPVHGYDAVDAQMKTDKRRHQPRELYKFKNEELRSYVINSLKQKISPFQISGRIKKDRGLLISHEAIYKFIYRDKLEGGDLWKNLRHKRRRRKPRIPKTNRPRIKNRKGIELRPAIVESKSRFGDLEIDTMIGRNHQGAILTVVDRYSKFLWAKFIGKNSAENVRRACVLSGRERKTRYPFFIKLENKSEILTTEAIKNHLAKCWTKSFSTDNDKSFVGHSVIKSLTGIPTYFTRPAAPHEKGAVEQLNKELRVYFPKGTDFNKVSQEELDQVAENLKTAPMKVLNWMTPEEALEQELALNTS